MARVFRNSHVKTRVKNAVGSLFSAVSTQTFHWKKPQRRIQLVKNAGRKQQAFCLKPAADKLVSLLIFAFPTPAVKITKLFSSSLPFSFFFFFFWCLCTLAFRCLPGQASTRLRYVSFLWSLHAFDSARCREERQVADLSRDVPFVPRGRFVVVRTCFCSGSCFFPYGIPSRPLILIY